MKFLKVFKSSVKTFLSSDPMTYAASLAFYTVISLPAILIIAVNILTQTYKSEQIETDFLYQLNRFLGPSTVNQAEAILENASTSASGFLPQIFGWVVLLISSTTVFISLQNGINSIWNVKTAPSTGIFKLIVDRVLTFAMLVSFGFVMIVSLALDSLLALLNDYIKENYEFIGHLITYTSNFIISMLVTTTIFALIFKVLPDVKIKWKNVWVGGLFTALMFLIGKIVIGIYLTSSDVGNAYGASGSLVIFLFWVYYSSILVLFGAKFTYEYSKLDEDFLIASETGVFIKEEILSQDKIKTDNLD